MAKVLIVDDALIMRVTIRRFLEKAGHTVVAEAANGEEAVRAYQAVQPDVVTMDITMPGTDGIEALAQIRAFDAQAVVVMISALGQQHKVLAALQAGAKSYILKPLQEEKLREVMNQVLEQTVCPIVSLQHNGHEALANCQDDCRRLQTAWQEPAGSLATPFIQEDKQGVCWFALLQPLACQTSQQLLEAAGQCGKTAIGFDLTVCQEALNGHNSQQMLDIVAALQQRRHALTVRCFSDDYVQFFRNQLATAGVDFQMVRR